LGDGGFLPLVVDAVLVTVVLVAVERWKNEEEEEEFPDLNPESPDDLDPESPDDLFLKLPKLCKIKTDKRWDIEMSQS
jgi:hypothetical protein